MNVPTVRTVEVWDLETRKVLEAFVYTNLWRLNVSFGPTFLSKDREAFAFDAVGGLGVKMLGRPDAPLRLLRMPEGPGSTNSFHSFDMSHDQRWVAAAQFNGAISLWDLRTGRHSFLPAKARGMVPALFFSPDGTRLMAGDVFGASLNIWDVDSRRQIGALPAKEFAFAGAFSPDGHAVATYSSAGQVEIWTAPSWEEIAAVESRDRPSSIHGEAGTVTPRK